MRPLALAACAVALGVAVGAPAQSLAEAGLAGSWTGVGTIRLPSGNSEAVRCRVRFRGSGNSYSMTATCATSSQRAEQTAVLQRVSANRYSGSFHNAEYNYTGAISVTVKGNKASASLSGGEVTGSMRLSR